MSTTTDSGIPSNHALIPRESNLYWIHCNRCFEIYVRKTRRFFLLACHHITCENCGPPQPAATPSGSPSYKCPICEKLMRGRQLGNNMPPHIKELFHPNPWLNDLPASRILRFQEKQRNHFQQGMERMRRSNEKLKQAIELAREKGKKQFADLEKLRRERKQLEVRVRKVQQQQKKIEQERCQREAERLRAPYPPPSSTDDSAIVSNTVMRSQMQRPRYPPLRAGSGRGTLVSASNPFAGYGPRMQNPNNSVEVDSFMHPSTNSFIL